MHGVDKLDYLAAINSAYILPNRRVWNVPQKKKYLQLYELKDE